MVGWHQERNIMAEGNCRAEVLSSWQLENEQANSARGEETRDQIQYPRSHIHDLPKYTWKCALLVP